MITAFGIGIKSSRYSTHIFSIFEFTYRNLLGMRPGIIVTMIPGEPQAPDFARAAFLPLSNQEVVFELYTGLTPLERVGAIFLSTIVLGAVVLGLLPDFSDRTIETARRSPVISVLIGIPGSLVLGAFLYFGQLLSHSEVGIFFGIPLVTVGLALLPTLTLLGIVATGESIGVRFGSGGSVGRLVVGAIGISVLAARPEAIAIGGGALMCLGVGAGVRVLVTGGTVTDPSERTVPPANKI